MDCPRARVVAVIQARCGSTRLPGKVMAPLAGRSSLGWVVRAAQASAEIDRVVVATSTSEQDDPIETLAQSWGVGLVRGSEDDVLSRFIQVIDADEPDAVVRLTADCPMLDPEVIDLVVRTWRASPQFDYVSTVLYRSLPRGLDVELVTVSTLRRVGQLAAGFHRAHVTSYIYSHSADFRVLGLGLATELSPYRVTLDTAEDLMVLQALSAGLGDEVPDWRTVVSWLDAHPDVAHINAGVAQKALERG